MHLIYMFMKRYKNLVNQEVYFDGSYQVLFANNNLSITYQGENCAARLIRGGKKPDHIHMLVGKTGSGKTNLLQLIGMKHDERSHRMWHGEDDSYFLLYAMEGGAFFAEICNVMITQLPDREEQAGSSIPAHIRDNAKRMASLRTVRFSIEPPLKAGCTYTRFSITQEYGDGSDLPKEKARDLAFIINSYDIHAFMKPPYPDEREAQMDASSDYLPRLVFPYHRTSLWQVCDYIREYIENVEPGSIKRQVAFQLTTNNFSEELPLELPLALAKEYWKFSARLREDASLKPKGKNGSLSNKQMFIHDLWTDYAIHLRKWIEKIHSYEEPDISPDALDSSGTTDVYQEYLDYRAERDYNDGFDPAELPDGEKISIIKRCIRLAEYIDRLADGDPHGLLWQITGDIKDICQLLNRLPNQYFTVDTFTMPVVAMATERYEAVINDLFERMEQYRPDDSGVFTRELLPYTFTHLSSGEYQYAKALGGIAEYRKINFSRGKAKRDAIILLDEPEIYMHPELARSFIDKLVESSSAQNNSAAMQIIIGTHSPFMLSDVLPDEITRLNIDKETGCCIVNNGSDRAYFGANIHMIMADSFFLDYTIGEHARKLLQSAHDRLMGYLQLDGALPPEAVEDIASIRAFLPNIGDQMILRSFTLALRQLDERLNGGDEA